MQSCKCRLSDVLHYSPVTMPQSTALTSTIVRHGLSHRAQHAVRRLFRLPCRQRQSEDAADAHQHDAETRRRARQQRRQAREERRRKLLAYYSAGSGWGRPAAGVLYNIANRFSLDDSLLLWCASTINPSMSLSRPLRTRCSGSHAQTGINRRIRSLLVVAAGVC